MFMVKGVVEPMVMLVDRETNYRMLEFYSICERSEADIRLGLLLNFGNLSLILSISFFKFWP